MLEARRSDQAQNGAFWVEETTLQRYTLQQLEEVKFALESQVKSMNLKLLVLVLLQHLLPLHLYVVEEETGVLLVVNLLHLPSAIITALLFHLPLLLRLQNVWLIFLVLSERRRMISLFLHLPSFLIQLLRTRRGRTYSTMRRCVL